MWCAPKLDAPQATPRRPLRVSGTIQIRARRPPAPPPLPPPGDPRSAPHRSILWYMAGRPPRGSRRGQAKFGAQEEKRKPGIGRLAVGCWIGRLTAPGQPSSPSFGQSSQGPGVCSALQQYPKQSET
uniref:Uncharacterized protein n=1 Tax=Mus musculus TaxID=10090 RepID=Q3TUL6_MOUSE|nr:unnamed protein product [Mus musculus]